MARIYGIGYIGGGRFGTGGGTLAGSGIPEREAIFRREFKSFAKLDAVSRNVCYAVGLAVLDMGLEYPLPWEAGIVATNATGCLEGDLRYFRDYVECGRTLGRGNLFVYTLPSSPLGEASIHFGLQGPALYMSGSGGSRLSSCIAMAADMVEDGESALVFAGMADEACAVFAAVAQAGLSANSPGMEASRLMGAGESFDEIIGTIRVLQGKETVR